MNKLSFFRDIKADLNLVEKELFRWVQAPQPVLTETSAHLLRAGGKRLRPAFILLTGRFYNYDLERLLPLAVALELIHMASLVHDDVVDNSLTRRGIPTVKARWGDQISIHTGSYLFARSLMLISLCHNPRIAGILSSVSTQMCQGEIMQMATTADYGQTFSDYLYRIKCKTALLISACCQVGAIATGAPEEAVEALASYGYYLGLAFQITDDILDMTADQKKLGKPIGSDLRQGIVTLPTIYALKHSNRREQLKSLLQQQPKTEAGIREALAIIQECRAIDFSFKVTDRYIRQAKAKLAILPPGRPRDALVDIAAFVGQRKF